MTEKLKTLEYDRTIGGRYIVDKYGDGRDLKMYENMEQLTADNPDYNNYKRVYGVKSKSMEQIASEVLGAYNRAIKQNK